MLLLQSGGVFQPAFLLRATPILRALRASLDWQCCKEEWTALCLLIWRSKRFKMCTRRPKQQDTANFSFERIQNVHETSKKARCGQLFHSKEFKMCTRRPKQQDTAHFFIRKNSKCARKHNKTRSTFSFQKLTSLFHGQTFQTKRLGGSRTFENRKKKSGECSQNSKIRSTFSFKMSKNEHKKCLLCRAVEV